MGYAARSVRDGFYGPRRYGTMWRLRERGAEAWGDGSYEPREARSAEPDPSEADLLDELGDEICRLSAHIHAATAHFLELLELAEGCTVSTLERRLRAWRRGSRREEAARERILHRSRRLVVVPADGGYVVRGWLPPEVGAVLLRALEAAEDALYRKELDAGAGAGDGSCEPASRHGSCEPRRTDQEAAAAAHRRRADAAGLLAERALAAGFGGESEEEEEEGVLVSGSRAERYQMFMHVDADTLAEEGEPGRSELEDGTRLAAETARRLACDAAAVHVNRGAGGETSLENTLLLCRRHHRLLHEEGWTVQWWGEGRPCFTDPRGGHHLDVGWQAPELPADPVRALVRENRRRGADPAPLTAGARWERERDVPDRVWFGASEALVIVLETGSGRSPA